MTSCSASESIQPARGGFITAPPFHAPSPASGPSSRALQTAVDVDPAVERHDHMTAESSSKVAAESQPTELAGCSSESSEPRGRARDAVQQQAAAAAASIAAAVAAAADGLGGGAGGASTGVATTTEADATEPNYPPSTDAEVVPSLRAPTAMMASTCSRRTDGVYATTASARDVQMGVDPAVKADDNVRKPGTIERQEQPRLRDDVSGVLGDDVEHAEPDTTLNTHCASSNVVESKSTPASGANATVGWHTRALVSPAVRVNAQQSPPPVMAVACGNKGSQLQTPRPTTSVSRAPVLDSDLSSGNTSSASSCTSSGTSSVTSTHQQQQHKNVARNKAAAGDVGRGGGALEPDNNKNFVEHEGFLQAVTAAYLANSAEQLSPAAAATSTQQQQPPATTPNNEGGAAVIGDPPPGCGVSVAEWHKLSSAVRASIAKLSADVAASCKAAAVAREEKDALMARLNAPRVFGGEADGAGVYAEHSATQGADGEAVHYSHGTCSTAGVPVRVVVAVQQEEQLRWDFFFCLRVRN